MKTTTLLLALTTSFTLAQGPLMPPPGVPAPSMKTLDQIEARTPIPKSPAVPIAGPHFTISQPGSYYLTGNITVSTGDAIVIVSDDVSLDLNGFTVRSTLDGVDIGAGVRVSGQRSHLSVRNGFVVSGSIVPDNVAAIEGMGFVVGIGPLIEGTDRVTQLTVTDVQVRGIASIGINAQGESILTRCSAVNCAEIGIIGNILRDCTATQAGIAGIFAINAMNCRGASLSGIGLVASENATNCHGSSVSSIGLQSYANASQCTGTSTANIGLFVQDNASDCIGTSDGASGWGLFCGGNATNCRGTGSNTTGLYCQYNATNCTGRATGTGEFGLDCQGNATNCTGSSSAAGSALRCVGNATNCTGNSYAVLNGIGLSVQGNATNCTGSSATLPGIVCQGTATSCRGKRNGGVAIQANIAVACTVDGSGTVYAASKFLGTP